MRPPRWAVFRGSRYSDSEQVFADCSTTPAVVSTGTKWPTTWVTEAGS